MMWSLAILLVSEALGELVHAETGLPIPGPVIGIALLLSGLALFARARPRSAPALPAADTLLSYLPLFFVPPGVSAVMQIGTLLHVWPAVLVGLIASSVLTFAVAGRLAQGLLERQERRTAANEPAKACSQGAAS